MSDVNSEQENTNERSDSSHQADYPGIDRPLRAMRKKCIDCSGGSKAEVKYCTVRDCDLWFYRLGKRPQTVKDQKLVNKQSHKKWVDNLPA